MNTIPVKGVESAGGVIINNDSVLLIRGRSSTVVGFPKGKIEKGESREEAAIREVREETGYEARIVGHLDSSQYQFTDPKGTVVDKIVHYFLMELTDSTAHPQQLQKGEDFEVQWVPLSEALLHITFAESRHIYKLALGRRSNNSTDS